MPGLYFEEFEPGAVIDHDTRRTVTEMDNVLFSSLTLNLAPLHPHNAERGVFERVGSVLHPSPAPRSSRTPARSPAAPETGPVDARRLLESWCAGQITAAEVARG